MRSRRTPKRAPSPPAAEPGKPICAKGGREWRPSGSHEADVRAIGAHFRRASRFRRGERHSRAEHAAITRRPIGAAAFFSPIAKRSAQAHQRRARRAPLHRGGIVSAHQKPLAVCRRREHCNLLGRGRGEGFPRPSIGFVYVREVCGWWGCVAGEARHTDTPAANRTNRQA